MKNVFETGVERDSVHVFVNYAVGFSHPSFQGFAELFWKQLSFIQPEIYISENLTLNVATSNSALFTVICDALRGALSDNC